MSISLSSCFPSQLRQSNIVSDRQSYLNDSLIGQVHDFSKDINQMDTMITSMEAMSKDIRSHLLDLQTMPGATNARSHLQQQTEHFESMVGDQLRSSLQRMSPVIMQTNLSSRIEPYSASQWGHQTPSREIYSSITGGHSPQERTDYEFCTPPDLTEEPESRDQVQTNPGMCRRKLQFERDTENRKFGFGNISPLTNEDDSFTNQITVTDELDGSHFTACLDQGSNKSSSQEKSSDTLDKRHNQTQTNMAAPEPTENSKTIGTKLALKAEKSEEQNTSADSNRNVNLKDLVSQAAKLLDNNGADLCIDTDSMVDTMLSEIREAFNQNVEKVFKDVNTSELLSKQSQETSYSKMTSAKKASVKTSNPDHDDSGVSFYDEKPEEYEMSEDTDDVDPGYHDYYNYCPPPSTSPAYAYANANFGSATWKSHRAKEAWFEGRGDKGDNRQRKKKKEEELRVEELEEEEEMVGDVFCPFITGGVRPRKGHKIDPVQPRKKCACTQDKKHRHHQKGTNSKELEKKLHLDAYDVNSSEEWTEITTPGQYCNKYPSKNKKGGKKSQNDKKSRGVRFSNTVYLIDNDGDVKERDILMPQGHFDQSYYWKYPSNKAHWDLKAHKKQCKKSVTDPYRVCTPRDEDDLSHIPVPVNQERTMHDKSLMTPRDIPTSKPAASPVAAWTNEWNDPSSPRTRTENWKCNSRVEDEQNGIFKSLTIESVSTDNVLPSNQGTTKDHKKDDVQRNGISDYNIAGGCGPNYPDWQVFNNPQNNPPFPGNSTESEMAFVCCILPQSIQNSNHKNADNSENVYISNMMLTDLKGEDLKNAQKIGQPIEASEARKVSYLVRELMEHMHANKNFLNKDHPTDRGVAAGTGPSPPGRKMSWVDAVKPEGKEGPSRLSQCGSPILFCYLPPEFLPKAHQVKSLKKPSKEPRKPMDTASTARDKVVKKSGYFNKGCQTESNSRILSDGNPGGLSWWVSAPPSVKKTPTPRIQQIYTNKLPPPVPVVTVKSVGKGSGSCTPERKPKVPQSPYTKKPKLGLNSSPSKRKPFLI